MQQEGPIRRMRAFSFYLFLYLAKKFDIIL